MSVRLSEIAPHLELLGEGIWTNRTVSQVSFPVDGNEQCFDVEDSSFWFRHRNDCILAAVEAFPPPGTFFDVGGGNGYVAQALQKAGIDVILIEPGREGVRNARKREVRQIIWGTLSDAALPANALPAIGLFDVLEHIEEDSAFLMEVSRLQPAGGRIYLTVPAHDLLWSHEDKLAGHARRYSLAYLTSLLEQSGYAVELATYYFGFLVLPIALLRVLPYRLGLGRNAQTGESVRADHTVSSRTVERALDYFTAGELRRLVAGKPGRLGASCLVVARKRQS